jgi:hypothetical protein
MTRPPQHQAAPPAPPPAQEAAILQAVQWIAEGHSAAHVAESLAEHFPGNPPAEILAAAHQQLAAQAAATPPGWELAAKKLLYERAVAAGELALAARLVDQIRMLSEDHAAEAPPAAAPPR